MISDLKKEVFEANMMLKKNSLVTLTWGNVSGIDREKGVVIIKPSGVEYDTMKWEDMLVVSLDTGRVFEPGLKPSSDTPTHLEIYRNFNDISGLVHTHSRFATVMAQGGYEIPALGTTHADYFFGSVPCTRNLTREEIENDYEINTGKIIVETFKDINPSDIPAVLVRGHGPFCWGESPKRAVENALVLEEISFMAYHNLLIDRDIEPVSQTLLYRHYYRKHGENAYYGQ